MVIRGQTSKSEFGSLQKNEGKQNEIPFSIFYQSQAQNKENSVFVSLFKRRSNEKERLVLKHDLLTNFEHAFN